MKHKFIHFVNAFKESNAIEVYIGSIVYSQKTQRKVVAVNSQVIYFFRHNQSSSDISNNIYLLDYPIFKLSRTKSKTKYRRIIYSNKVETYGSDSNILKYYAGNTSSELPVGDYKGYLFDLSYDVGFFKEGLFRVDVNQALFSIFEKYIIDQLVLISNEHRNICLNIESPQLRASIDFEGVIQSVKNKTRHFRKLGKISCNQNSFMDTAYVNVFICHSVTVLDLLVMSQENNPIIITLFNQLELSTSFDKLIDSKYMAFIPIRVINASTLSLKHISDIVLKLQNSLSPVYRDDFKLFSNSIVGKDEWGITNDVELGNLFKEEFRQILYECIQLEINRSMSISDEYDFLTQFDFLVELLTLSSGSLLIYRGTISQSISLFDKFLNVISELISNKHYEESTITFYIVILAHALDLHKNFSLLLTEHDQLYEKKVIDAFIKCDSTLYKILLASILKETDEKKYSPYVDVVFYNNTLQSYQDLFALLFNEHGEDHDSPIGMYVKKSEVYNLKDEKSINSLVNTIEKCISLIKYVRFYDESLDDVYQLENSMRVNIEGLKKASISSLEQFNADIEKLKKIADKRFYKIRVSDIETELKTFIRLIIIRLKSKLDINESLERYLDSIIIIGSGNFEVNTKSIVICNDPFILDEIASLIYDAIKNNSEPFSIKGNEEKSNSFWITCEIIHSYVVISIYNSTSKETSAIRVDINNKIRVGKQYLNRFNISVEYPEPLDDEICGTDENVFKTVIKYPYFN